jgi:hypothetical protein
LSLLELGENLVDQSKLIHKIAVSSDNRELGRIFRFEDLVGKTIKKLIPHVIIHVVRAFNDDINIAIEAGFFLKDEDNYAWFNITKKEFDQIVKIQRRIRNDRESKAEYIPDTPFLGSRGGYGYYRDKKRGK